VLFFGGGRDRDAKMDGGLQPSVGGLARRPPAHLVSVPVAGELRPTGLGGQAVVVPRDTS